jgi:hypothetical protein
MSIYAKTPSARYLATLFSAALALAFAGLTTGCATTATTASEPAPVALSGLQGMVHGGQQPVVGATVTAYATGATGYGSAARVLGSTTTTAGGNFSLTAYQTCLSTDFVYLVATGGNPGVAGTQNNSALALMTGLGPCANANQVVNINEVSTVGTVWALAPFMTDATHVGTSATNVQGLTNAFNTINYKMVNLNRGVAPSAYLNTVANVFPTAEVNTLADILAACVNTVDTAGPTQSPTCQSIFSAAAVGGVAPTNTIQLALNLAKNPTVGLSLFSQGTADAPFQPTLGTTTAPTSWTIAISYNFNTLDPTPNVPKGIAIDPTGYVYSVGAGNSNGTNYNSLQEISPLDSFVIETHYNGTSIENQPSALAIDIAGDIWTTDSANNSIIETGPNAPIGGGGIHANVNGLSAPNAIAIDAAGNIWVTNKGNNSVSEFTSTGAPVGNFTSGIVSPVAIAISPK